MKTGLYKLSLLATTLALAAPCARAAISVGDGTAASAQAGTDLPELVLIIWDKTAELSYTKDLGIVAYSDYYAKGDTSKNLFVYGQQDAGYQKLFPALNSDPNFKAFSDAVMAVKQPLNQAQTANQFWGVIGVQLSADIIAGAGSHTLFTTLSTGSLPTGQFNENYGEFTGLDSKGQPVDRPKYNNSEIVDTVSNGAVFFGELNQPLAGSTYNTHQCERTPKTCSAANAAVKDGSSFDDKKSIGYVGTFLSLPKGGLTSSNGHAPIFNPVGKSSWFYMGTTSNDIMNSRIAVDEFDNLKHDAYWGLGVDSMGNYILSYTLEAAITPTATAAGALLRLSTDYTASYGNTRLITLPNDPFTSMATVTAVPEPATWGLMGLGLAVLGLRARRQAGRR